MPKIITLTFNPSIDKTTSTDKIVPEKKLRCVNPTYAPGGGGINVSRALQHLGIESLPMYFSGGYNKIFFKKLLQKENIQSLIVPIKAPIRTNIIVVENSTGLQFRFGMESEPAKKNDWKLFLKKFDQQNNYDIVVASGSLPAGIPPDIFGKIAAIVKKRNAKLIVDTSGDALQHAVHEGVFLIKPNINELSKLYGKEKLDNDEIVTAAKTIIKNGGCEVMVISMGENGAMLVTKDDHIHIKPPVVEVKSTVGAGDSMVAGIVFGLSKGWDWHYILKFGIACGTAATMNEGTTLCKKHDVYTILEELNAN